MLFSFRSLTLEIMYKIMNITTLLWQNFLLYLVSLKLFAIELI